MKKETAIKLFGTVEGLRKALGLRTRSAIYMWPDGEDIPDRHALRITHVLLPKMRREKAKPKGHESRQGKP